MARKLDIHTIEITGYPLYICNVCGTEALGKNTSIRLGNLAFLNSLDHIVSNLSNDTMPSGWVSSGRFHKCPSCHSIKI